MVSVKLTVHLICVVGLQMIKYTLWLLQQAHCVILLSCVCKIEKRRLIYILFLTRNI